MSSGSIPLHEPTFGAEEWAYVRECLDSGWVSSGGPFVERFERALAETVGTAYCVATVNGTSALHLAYIVAGIHTGDLVLVPTLTFIAPVNAVRYCGADPVFLDADPLTLGMSPEALLQFLESEVRRGRDGILRHRGTNRRIAACVLVHLFGHPVDLAPILETCGRYEIPVIEDAAEALGSLYHNRPLGSFGLLATLSFNGNKIITTGGGGAVLTNDTQLAERARHLSTQAKQDELRYVHDSLGFNFRLPSLNAALGLGQLERLGASVERKRQVTSWYREAFDAEGIPFFVERSWARSNYWLNTVFVGAARRENVLRHLREVGIGARPLFALNHTQAMYRDSIRGPVENAVRLVGDALNLPSSSHLSRDVVHGIVSEVVAALRRTGRNAEEVGHMK